MSDTIELVAVQAYMRLDDYLDGTAFVAKIAALADRVAQARERDAAGAFRHPALVVFPEHIGTFLSAAGYADLVRPRDDTDALLRRVVLRRPLRLVAAMLRHRTWSPTAGVLLAEGAKMHAIYREAFSAAARRLGATVVAGSIILAENADGLDAATFHARDARLYNLAYTFAPDGRCIAVTRKVHLVPTLEDTLPLTPGRREDVAPIATECGRVGVMICYDGFAEPHTEREPRFRPLGAALAAAGTDVIAQPSANPWPWNERWVFCGPGEDQLRRDQWLAEGLFTQLRAMPGVRYAVNPQLVGDLLGTRFDGRSYIFGRDGAGAPTIIAAAARDDLDPRSEEVVVARVAAPGVDARAAATA